MRAERFIADKIRFKGRASTAAAAISAMVVTVAVCVSAGFRTQIRRAVDAVLVYNPDGPVSVEAVEPSIDAEPLVLLPGMLRHAEQIEGVVFRGDTLVQGPNAVVSQGVARRMGLEEGSRFQAYFFNEGKVKARVFEVGAIVPDAVGSEFTVLASEAVLRRVALLDEGRYSALEVHTGAAGAVQHSRAKAALAAGPLLVQDVVGEAPAMYDWLAMIDANVLAILLLMIVVAGFNMITGLLIMVLRHVNTVGVLKALGMSDVQVAGVFLRVGSRAAAVGLGAGTLLGLALCFVQSRTHFLTLDPANYFLSYVPVDLPVGRLLASMAATWAVVTLLLAIPCKYISKIDPSKTIASE